MPFQTISSGSTSCVTVQCTLCSYGSPDSLVSAPREVNLHRHVVNTTGHGGLVWIGKAKSLLHVIDTGDRDTVTKTTMTMVIYYAVTVMITSVLCGCIVNVIIVRAVFTT